MPDGSMVAMHQLENGEWVTTKERLNHAEMSAEFMKRFSGTDTVPHPHRPQTEGSLAPKSNTEKILSMIENAKASHNRLDAYLGDILGSPEDIIAGDPICKEKLKKVRARPQELRHVLGLMDLLGASDLRWQKVRHHLLHMETP